MPEFPEMVIIAEQMDRTLQQVLRGPSNWAPVPTSLISSVERGRYGLDNLFFAYQDEALCP